MAIESREPNFESWVAEEPHMHERRGYIMARAAEFGDQGWMFAEEFLPGYHIEAKHNLIALATLMTQGYLASDLDNPRILRVTEEGMAWQQAQVAQAEAATS